VAETSNIAKVASAVSKDIFQIFKWTHHPLKDDNFNCVDSLHIPKGRETYSHPADVIFRYDDPYLRKAVYLNTDLKSYKEETLKTRKIRDALASLAKTVGCARLSEQWRDKYGVTEAHEVRGLLFVHNHDGKYKDVFHEMVRKVNVEGLPLAQDCILHFLGPHDIQRLWTIGNDILRMKGLKELPEEFTFYYPDLVLSRRHTEDSQAATIESLTGPFLVIKHGDCPENKRGYVVYYNRQGNSVEEFMYLIDCLSRFQLLESDQALRIRCVSEGTASDVKSRFENAVARYAKLWGFEPSREKILSAISIDRVTTATPNYEPGDFGWDR
jgi:hypothetical protein